MTGDEYQTLARALAQALGSEWSYHPPRMQEGERVPTYASIDGPGGCQINLTRDWNKDGRVSIHGSYPKPVDNPNGGQRDFLPYHDKRIKPITCDVSRGPEAIAKDIKRRFLPHYLPSWQKQLGYHDEVVERFATVREGYAILGELVGKTAELVSHNGKLHIGSYREGFGGGTIQLNFDSETGLSGTLDLHWVPFDKLTQVVRVLVG